MKRGAIKPGRARSWGSTLHPRSPKTEAKYVLRRALVTTGARCEAREAGAPGECFGPLTLHEVLPRARGGSITDPENCRTVCAEHNRLISQDTETMRWAYENNFLRHSWEGS